MPKKQTLPKNFFIPCNCCNGAGKVPDPKAQGAMMKAERQAAKATQKEVAEQMGLSDNYICDLESGNRRWTEDLVTRYRTALKAKTFAGRRKAGHLGAA